MMLHDVPAAAITAIVYGAGDDVDPLLQQIAAHPSVRGPNLCGSAQHNQPLVARGHCDMVLEELASGASIAITQDLGAGARGCRLDVGELLRAMALAMAALATDPDLLVINRFGKTEAEGGGVRPLIADAVDRGIPVLIAVPWRNIASWRVFAGELAVEFGFGDLPVDPAAACRLLGLAPPADRHPAGVASATSEPAPPS